MKFKFIISKWANLFFLIDNFAEYRTLKFKEYNIEIIKQFGKLTKKEKAAIRQYKKIINFFKKQPEGEKSFIKLKSEFYFQNNASKRILKSIYRILPEKEYQFFLKILDAFSPRFKKIWGKYNNSLKQHQKILKNQFLPVKPYLKKAKDKLAIFFENNQNNKYNFFEIYLIIVPTKEYTQAGMAMYKNKIVLATAVFQKNDFKIINSIWRMMLHELTHILFEPPKYKKLIKEYLSNKKGPLKLTQSKNIKESKWKTALLLREAINSSVVWNIFDFEKVFLASKLKQPKDKLMVIQEMLQSLKPKNKKNIKSFLSDWNTVKLYTAWKIRNDLKKYLLDKRKINRKYIDKIYNYLLNYPKNLYQDLKNKKAGI